MLKSQIKSAKLNGSSSLSFYKQYAPSQYSDRQHEYFNHTSRTFANEYAKYSSDYVEAEIQGLDPDEPFEYTTVHIRFANVIKPSGALSNEFDNYKNIMIAERPYEYIRRGAKVKTMGNTWLVINPNNASEGGTAVIQRCDAVWNYLDYYGNVCSEPMAIDRLLKRASTPDSQRSTMVTKGYFNALVQYNDATKQLSENSRMVLGSSAYMLTGFSDFQREFTDVEDSVNLMEFALRYEEPNYAIDDMENHVAGGLTFAWDIAIGGEATIMEGETATYTASSTRTSGAKTEAVESTDEYPISYVWSSSDESVASVDEDGTVTAISAGAATITATLKQNENKYQEFTLTVATTDTDPHVAFAGTYPDSLGMYRTVTLNAAYYENGEATENTLMWAASGADEESYTLEVDDDDANSATLTCWGGSVTPLTITASYGNYSASHTIDLEGI